MSKIILLFSSLIFSSAVINYASASQPTQKSESDRLGKVIKLANAQVLETRLFEAGFEHFVEKTNIVQNLGEKEKYPLGVVVSVETALYDYNEYLQQPMMATIMQMRKPQLIACLLQDHPEAIESLKKDGILK